MLKLLKHECKSTLRVFLPLYGALIVFAALNKAFFSMPFLHDLLGGVPRNIFIFLYVAICVAVIVLSMTVSIQRFYRNLLGNEGYLMHTLPVSPWQLMLSKLITSTLWSTISTLLVILCSLFMGLSFQELAQLPQNIGIALRLSSGLLGVNLTLAFFEVLGVTVLSYAFFFLTTYLAMAVGQLFTRHRAFLSFVAYAALSLIIQVTLTYGIYQFNRHTGYFRWTEEVDPMLILHRLCLMGTVISVFYGTICFFLSNWLLKRHLNLL